MRLIEKAIAVVSPGWALERQRQRMALDNLRRYEGAGKGKRNRHIRPPSTSSQTEVSMAHQDLRNQARKLRRNNPWAKRGIASFTSNVVGKGIKLSLDGKGNDGIEKMEKLWKDWAKSKSCDFYGKRNLYGIQRLIVRSVFRDGEVLVRKVTNVKGIPLQLQVLEADYLVPHTLTLSSGMTQPVNEGNKLQDGVEFDPEGRVVAYHIYKSHPGDQDVYNGMETMRVKAEDMLHIFKGDRPGQHRGITEMDTTIIRLGDLDNLEDATLIKQKIAASFSVFIHDNGNARPGEATDDEGYPMERIEPGLIQRLAPGEQISVAAPADSSDYPAFTSRVLQGAAAGMLNTYENLTGDYGNVNFSSGRMGWIEHQRIVEEWQDEIVIVQFCESVWSWFVVAANIANGNGVGTNFSVTWTPPRREMLDPVKETKGLVEKLRARLISWQDAARELGYDPDVLFDQIAADQERFNAADIKTAGDPAHDSPNQEPASNAEPEDQNNE